MGWDLNNNGISWCWLFDVTQWEVLVVSLQEVVLSENINTHDLENSAIGDEISIVIDFTASEISVTNELLSWLINVERFRQLLSSEVHWEWVSSVIWEVYFSDLYGIVSQEIVPDELKVWSWSCEESQHLSIVVQELLLGWNSSSTKLLLQELKKFWILLWWNWFLWVHKAVFWARLCIWLWLSTVL